MLPFGPHLSFHQVHQRRPSDDDKFCMNSFLQAQLVVPNPQAIKKALEKCMDYVNIADAFDTNRFSFEALIIRGMISFCWH